MKKYDSILIPGGGLLEDGSLPPWTIARLEKALTHKTDCRWFILLSGGTVHKPPPLNGEGFPFFESHELAKNLINAGVSSDRILTEISSYDTIGNAYFARLLFTDPLRFKTLLIITSDFHMQRTRAIFEWIFRLPPTIHDYEIEFESAPDRGLTTQALAARVQREEKSLANLNKTIQKVNNLEDFIIWLYREHAAYAPNKPFKPLSPDELKSY